jgi:hypothetical protein
MTLAWSLEDGCCEVSADDGNPLTSLALKRKPYRGTPICYLRLKSGAAETSSDFCGFLVDSVFADTGLIRSGHDTQQGQAS